MMLVTRLLFQLTCPRCFVPLQGYAKASLCAGALLLLLQLHQPSASGFGWQQGGGSADESMQAKGDLGDWLRERSRLEWNSTELLNTTELERQRRDDQALGSAYFIEGRMLMRTGALPEAVERFQRAWRFSSGSCDAANDLLFLLLQLDRDLEATRYAALIEPDCLRDSETVLDLAGLLTDAEEDAQAVRYYRQWLADYGTESGDSMRLLVQMEIGRLSFLMEQYEEASSAFEQVLEASRQAEAAGRGELVRRTLFVDPQTTWGMMGESFFRAGRWEQAEQVFELAFAIEPTAPEYRLWQARLAAAQGDDRSAMELLQAAFDDTESALDPEAFELLRELMQRRHGDDVEACQRDWIARLEAFESQGLGTTRVLRLLAEANRDAGNEDKAISYYERLWTIAPAEENVRKLAELYEARERWEMLLSLYASVYEFRRDLKWFDPEHSKFKPGSLIAEKILEIANQEMAEGLDRGTDHAMVLALIACRNGKHEAARKFYELARATTSEPGALDREWTLELMSNEAYAETVRFLEWRLENAANGSVETQFLLAGAYAMTNQEQRALASAQSAFDQLPSSLVVRNRLAWVLQRQEKFDQAREIYEATLAEYGNRRDSLDEREGLRQTRMGYAAVAAEQGQMEEAEQLLLTVLDEFPDDAVALNDLGFLWGDHGKHLELSYQMIERAVVQEPDNASFQDSLGWILLRLGRYEEAVNALAKATALAPEDPGFWEHLGDAYQQWGRPERAQEAWRRAQQCLPSDSQDEVRVRLQEKIAANDSTRR